MITEDYVSFETAKLLKEKGFDWECIGYYVDYEPNDVKYSFLGETNSTWESRCCSAPTHQMAMKWLRDVHGIHLGILITFHHLPRKYEVHIMRLKEINDIVLCPYEDFDAYKEACEVGIRYCLENLI